MKPDWSDAPEWASYLAQDPDGTWFWYENMPYLPEVSEWIISVGRCESAGSSAYLGAAEPRP